MNAHHFLAAGAMSPRMLEDAVGNEFGSEVTRLIISCGLTIMSFAQSYFPHNGLTAAWILAESHLVIHVWTREGFATIDLHVCDYTQSNESKAKQLANELSAYCFVPSNVAVWQHVPLTIKSSETHA